MLHTTENCLQTILPLKCPLFISLARFSGGPLYPRTTFTYLHHLISFSFCPATFPILLSPLSQEINQNFLVFSYRGPQPLLSLLCLLQPFSPSSQHCLVTQLQGPHLHRSPCKWDSLGLCSAQPEQQCVAAQPLLSLR